MIELDGAEGEGGGQILRSSLTLSLLTGKPFHLRNIRARRSKPGLQPQHLMCVQAAAAISGAATRGAAKGSSDLTFEPGPVCPGRYHFPIGTAGATALVLHTVYLPLALRCDVPSTVTIEGGTHVADAPCFHFLETTWCRYLDLMGIRLRVEMKRPGFYPRGGGRILAYIQPCPHPRGLIIDPMTPAQRISGVSLVAGLPMEIARRQAHRARYRLENALENVKVEIAEGGLDDGPGTVLALTMHTSPVPSLFFALGERGKAAERVADDAVEEALKFHLADPPGVDVYSADQIALPLALAKGCSTYPVSAITQHLLTNIAVIRSFLERDIRCEGKPGMAGRVVIS